MMRADGVPELLTISQVSRVTGEPERRIRHWVERGLFRVVQPSGEGGRRYLRRSEVEEWARLMLGVDDLDLSPLL